MVNVAALPDKGERLRTQVKELEDALESLSLTAAAQPGSSASNYTSTHGLVLHHTHTHLTSGCS